MEGKSPRRRSYLNDFQPTAGGEYVYTGALYGWAEPGQARRRALIRLWLGAALPAMLIVAAGCIPVPGMQNCPYVLLPYAGALVSQAAVLWLMCRLSYGGERLRAYVYEATVGRFRVRGGCALGFAALTLLGHGVYLLRNGTEGHACAALLFWLLLGGCAACQLWWLRTACALRWTK